MIRTILALLRFRWKYRREFKYRKKIDVVECPSCRTRYHNYKGKLTTCIICKNIMK